MNSKNLQPIIKVFLTGTLKACFLPKSVWIVNVAAFHPNDSEGTKFV
ncbi:MAG: hypothetical protein P8M80_09840 [Pirellulaceae bacterium]|nr:hypothetical protein [Pirellulaceae bacterium]